MRGQKHPGRESIPNSLTPPPGYAPPPTRLQAERLASSLTSHPLRGVGRPLSPRSIAMLGKPCPGGWESNNGYCKHACRCEACRAAHREHRLAQLHRAKQAA